MDLTEELARVINPDAFADDAEDYFDDVPVARAEASLYATRVVTWLADHDREVRFKARQVYALEVGRELLAILPPADDRAADVAKL